MIKRISQVAKDPSRNHGFEAGFTLIELLMVLLIMIIVAGMGVPKFMNFIHAARLEGACSDLSGLFQQARIRAVQDDNYYTTYIITVGTTREAYVDLKKNGGTGPDTLDPLIQIANEVTPVAASGAPNTSSLKGLFLPSGSTLTVNDGEASTTPVIFSARGLPCTSESVTGGSICNSAGGATAFWLFFQDNVTLMWEAVTISPAGRIQRWRHAGATWTKF